jgi:hypothetical protein
VPSSDARDLIFEVHGAQLQSASSACPAFGCSDAQIYALFRPALDANVPQGLWFDLIRIAGSPADTTLTIYATDVMCLTVENLGTWEMADVLSGPAQWRSSCVTLTPHQVTSQIGFRFSSADVDLGMQGLRFGPPCPAP